jgi:hypothetical protein
VEETILPRGDGKADLKLRVVPLKQARVGRSDEIRYEVSKDLCRTLFLERRDAEREGRLNFNAHFDFVRGVTIERGTRYRVGRIEFLGNRRYSDSLIRRHFLLDEGTLFNEGLLRRSIARLNRAALFDPVDASHVVVTPNPVTGFADVTVRLTDRRPGAWRLAGPWPLEASINARIPKWTTFAVSVGLFGPTLKLLNLPRRFVPVLAVQRPYTSAEGWKSGFAISPQTGWRATAVGYAITQMQQRLVLPAPERPLAIESEKPLSCEVRTSILRKGVAIVLGHE